MKLIFMGTPQFAVPTLQALLAAPQHQLVAVYSQPPRPAGRGQKLTASPVHQLAEAHGVPVFTPTSLKSDEAQREFAALGADAAIVAAYGLLLPQAVLDAPRYGCINVHPSDLPRWRGAAPLQRTIMAGDTHTALCIMQMEAGLDTGPVLLREPHTIARGTTTAMLHDTMAERGAQGVLTVLAQIENGTAIATPQATEGILHAAKITKAEAALDWQLPAETLYHRILGLNPAPMAHATLGGEVVKILRAEVVPDAGNAPAGTVLSADGLIACGSGALQLMEIQRPNKRPLPAAEAFRGWPLVVGEVL